MGGGVVDKFLGPPLLFKIGNGFAANLCVLYIVQCTMYIKQPNTKKIKKILIPKELPLGSFNCILIPIISRDLFFIKRILKEGEGMESCLLPPLDCFSIFQRAR